MDRKSCTKSNFCSENKKTNSPFNEAAKLLVFTVATSGALSIQPKIPVISVGTSNGTDHFGLVRPEYWGPALKVVLFDRSGHFGRSDRNVPFHLTKSLSPVPLFCILLARTITKRAVAWFGSVEPEGTVPLNTENFRNFKPEFLLNGKRPRSTLWHYAN